MTSIGQQMRIAGLKAKERELNKKIKALEQRNRELVEALKIAYNYIMVVGDNSRADKLKVHNVLSKHSAPAGQKNGGGNGR